MAINLKRLPTGRGASVYRKYGHNSMIPTNVNPIGLIERDLNQIGVTGGKSSDKIIFFEI